jgi:hypothetical protein
MTNNIDSVLQRIELDTLREEQALAQLAEIGITFPPDKGHDAYVRDYGHRWKFTPVEVKPAAPVKVKRDWSEKLIWVSTLGIIAVSLLLIWSEFTQ